MTENIAGLASEIVKLKKREKKRCNEENLDTDESEFTPEYIANRKTQCALLNMNEVADVRFGKKLGSGIEGTVNQFRFGVRGKDAEIKYMVNAFNDAKSGKIGIKTSQPIFYKKSKDNSAFKPPEDKKQEWLNASQDDLDKEDVGELYWNADVQRLEGLIGMHVNLISHLTPNYPYYYDIRHFSRNQSVKNVLMSKPFDNFEIDKANYGMITELIDNNRTFKDFLLESRNYIEFRRMIPDILIQILFSVYIAVTELGLVHFDLHPGNILLTPTTEQTIIYKVPLAPSVFFERYNVEDLPAYLNVDWDQEDNTWILNEKKEDETNFRYPIYQNIDGRFDNQLSDTPRYGIFEFGSKFKQPVRTFPVEVNTHGIIVKIVDFGFASMYFGKTFVVNRLVTERLFRNLKKPTEPYVVFDIWRILVYTLDTLYGSPFNSKYLFDIFEEYAQDMKTLYENKRITLNDMTQFRYLDRIPLRFRDNQYVLNACLDALSEMSKEFNKKTPEELKMEMENEPMEMD